MMILKMKMMIQILKVEKWNLKMKVIFNKVKVRKNNLYMKIMSKICMKIYNKIKIDKEIRLNKVYQKKLMKKELTGEYLFINDLMIFNDTCCYIIKNLMIIILIYRIYIRISFNSYQFQGN